MNLIGSFTGVKIMEQARHQLESAKVDPQTGLHDPDVIEPPPLTPNTIAIVVQKPMDVGKQPILGQVLVVCTMAGIATVKAPLVPTMSGFNPQRRGKVSDIHISPECYL